METRIGLTEKQLQAALKHLGIDVEGKRVSLSLPLGYSENRPALIVILEEATEAVPASAVHEFGGWRGPGPWNKAMSACANCDTWVTLDGIGAVVYSRDRGVTWTPGPAVCPGKLPWRP